MVIKSCSVPNSSEIDVKRISIKAQLFKITSQVNLVCTTLVSSSTTLQYVASRSRYRMVEHACSHRERERSQPTQQQLERIRATIHPSTIAIYPTGIDRSAFSYVFAFHRARTTIIIFAASSVRNVCACELGRRRRRRRNVRKNQETSSSVVPCSRV